MTVQLTQDFRFLTSALWSVKKEGKKEGREEERKEGRKKERKKGEKKERSLNECIVGLIGNIPSPGLP
jgi:predicted transposase YdaD